MGSVSRWSESGDGKREMMLFGVRVVVDPMRKCVSLNNLSDYETEMVASEALQISSSSERKRGIPWTEKEHKRFLLGLQKVGKGDWKGISRNYVKSRTPTQVASHAQKYFLRRTNLNRRRRRSSLFDITTDTVTEMPMEQDLVHHAQDNTSPPQTNISSAHQVPTRTENAPQQAFHPNSSIQFVPLSLEAKPAFNLHTDAQLSLNLSLSSSFNLNDQSNSRHSAFAMMPSFSDGDSNSSSIRVA